MKALLHKLDVVFVASLQDCLVQGLPLHANGHLLQACGQFLVNCRDAVALRLDPLAQQVLPSVEATKPLVNEEEEHLGQVLHEEKQIFHVFVDQCHVVV